MIQCYIKIKLKSKKKKKRKRENITNKFRKKNMEEKMKYRQPNMSPW